MAKNKKKTDEGTVEVTIDGVKITIPLLVKRLLEDQRKSIHYYNHVLALWMYKSYDENSNKSIDHEIASFINESIPEIKEMIEHFKEQDAKQENNLEVVEDTDIN